MNSRARTSIISRRLVLCIAATLLLIILSLAFADADFGVVLYVYL